MHTSLATKKSIFEIVLGMYHNTTLEVAISKIEGKCPAAYKYAHDKQKSLDEAQDRLRKDAK